MAGPFKMKGSPMQRNFGISPMKNEELKGKKRDWVFGSDVDKFTKRLELLKLKDDNIKEGKGPRKTSGLGPRA